MKFKKTFFLLSLFSLCACTKPNYVEVKNLSKDITDQIKESYLETRALDKTLKNDVDIRWNLGVFDDTIYVNVMRYYNMFDGETPAIMYDVKVKDKYICTIDCSYSVQVYTVGDVCLDISRAYELNKINDDHIKVIIKNAKEQGLRK